MYKLLLALAVLTGCTAEELVKRVESDHPTFKCVAGAASGTAICIDAADNSLYDKKSYVCFGTGGSAYPQNAVCLAMQDPPPEPPKCPACNCYSSGLTINGTTNAYDPGTTYYKTYP